MTEIANIFSRIQYDFCTSDAFKTFMSVLAVRKVQLYLIMMHVSGTLFILCQLKEKKKSFFFVYYTLHAGIDTYTV
jgi:hypothetical protein